MDAMIFAAGLGTRLRPLTDAVPKPLIEVGGVAMLERVARRLIAAGADRLIINAHHLGEQVAAFVDERAGFGVDVRVSREPEYARETGGGLRYAAHLFRRDGPFFLHNSDVLTDAPLESLFGSHDDGALATLGVLRQASSRYLVFDDAGLVGYADRQTAAEQLVRPARGELRRHDFMGIHVAAPRLFAALPDADAYSLVSVYLRQAAAGARIVEHVFDDCDWVDIGSHDALGRAQALVARWA